MRRGPPPGTHRGHRGEGRTALTAEGAEDAKRTRNLTTENTEDTERGRRGREYGTAKNAEGTGDFTGRMEGWEGGGESILAYRVTWKPLKSARKV
jgi:hypothetical protein